MDFIELALQLNQSEKVMKKETIVKFYSKYRTYIFPAMIILSSLFLIIFVIYPQTVKLLANQEATTNLINKSKILETKVSALESFNEEDLSRKVGYALGVYPTDKDFGNVLGLLQQSVSQSGFSIDSISLGRSAGKVANSESFEVKLETKGPKVLFQTLLDNLENSPRLVRINSIDTSLSQVSQAVGASLAIEFLYADAPKSFGPIDAPLPEITQKDEELITTLARISATIPNASITPSSPRGKANPFE